MIANLSDAMAEIGRTAQENETLRKQIKDLGAEVVDWQKKATDSKRVSLGRFAEVERLQAALDHVDFLGEAGIAVDLVRAEAQRDRALVLIRRSMMEDDECTWCGVHIRHQYEFEEQTHSSDCEAATLLREAKED